MPEVPKGRRPSNGGAAGVVDRSSAARPVARRAGRSAEAREEAKRHRAERLTAAALQVFHTHGLDASVAEITQTAGLGMSSFYRTFDSKKDLISHLAALRLSEYETYLQEAAAMNGAWEGFCYALWQVATHQQEDPVLDLALRETTVSSPELDRRQSVHRSISHQLMIAAQREGTMRPDATYRDIRLIYNALGSLRPHPKLAEAPPEAWRRLLELLLDGLRAQPATNSEPFVGDESFAME
ncbi:MAG: TetR/AcrR family transcriptional regulator [Acidimicrobiales bacterium]|nr:TetR/AcrR family transcriptional regulator [Acidimicrobiales bacterium]